MKSGDILSLAIVPGVPVQLVQPPPQRAAPPPEVPAQLSREEQLTWEIRENAVKTKEYFQNNGQELERALRTDPELGQAILEEDLGVLEAVLRMRHER